MEEEEVEALISQDPPRYRNLRSGEAVRGLWKKKISVLRALNRCQGIGAKSLCSDSRILESARNLLWKKSFLELGKTTDVIKI